MAESDSSFSFLKSLGLPTFLVVILTGVAAVLFGGGNTAQQPRSETDKSARATPQPSDLVSPVSAFLQFWPKVRDQEHSPHECSLDQFSPLSSKSLGSLLAHLDDKRQEMDLEFLIVTLPDPNDTQFGRLFDNAIDSIQTGLTRVGWRFTGKWIPWSPGGKPTDGTKVDDSKDLSRLTTPGVMLFRQAKTDRGRHPLLLVFLVGETPTTGLHKRALIWALDAIAHYQVRGASLPKLATGGGTAKSESATRVLVRIVGPYFSGTGRSLGMTLAEWSKTRTKGKSRAEWLDVRIRDGSATQVLRGPFLRDCDATSDLYVSFDSTTIRNDFLIVGLIKYLRDRNGPKLGKMAIFHESSTGFGAGALPDVVRNHLEKQDEGVVEISFPYHLAAMAQSYERQLSEQNKSSRLPQGSFLLDPTVKDGEDLEVFPTFSGLTSVVDEITLRRKLSALASQDVHTIGIVATDVRDIIFIASIAHDYCPDVTVFTTTSDVLLGHPIYASRLRGMLAIDAYPLCPEIQAHTSRGDTTALQLFDSSSEEGIYNAIVTLMDESEGWRHVLDYRSPDPIPIGQRVDLGPRVWISCVGANGLWPVAHYSEAVAIDEWNRMTTDGKIDHSESFIAWPASGLITADQDRQTEQDSLLLSLPRTFVLLGFVVLTVTFWFAFTELRTELEAIFTWLRDLLRRSTTLPDPDTSALTPHGFHRGVYHIVLALIPTCLHTYVFFLLGQSILSAVLTWPHGFKDFYYTLIDLGFLLALLGTVLFWIGLTTFSIAQLIRGHWTERAHAFELVFVSAASLLFLTLSCLAGAANSNTVGYIRTTSLGNGLSSIPPLLFLGSTWALWSLRMTKRLDLSNGPWTNQLFGRIKVSHNSGLIETLLRDLKQSATEFHDVARRTFPLRWREGLLIGMLMALLVLLIELVTHYCFPIDHATQPILLLTGMWGGLLVTLLGYFRFHRLAKALMLVLRSLAQIPIQSAFRSLPTEFTEALGSHLDRAALDRRLAIPLAYLRSIDQESSRGGQGQTSSHHPATATVPPNSADVPRCLESRAAAMLGEMAEHWRAGIEISEYVTAKQDQNPPSLQTQFVAMALMYYVSTCLAQLRNLSIFLAVGPVLLLFVLLSYPLQPHGLLLTALGATILLTVGGLLYTYVKLDSDELMSRMTDTTAGKVEFDSSFFMKVATILLPVIFLLISQVPMLSDMFGEWLGPLGRILK